MFNKKRDCCSSGKPCIASTKGKEKVRGREGGGEKNGREGLGRRIDVSTVMLRFNNFETQN